MKTTKFIRCRFCCASGDPSPIKWPPPGPYWCTGYNSFEHPIVVAYIKKENQLLQYWPDATDIDIQINEDITFTDRFTEPDWWKKSQSAMKESVE